MISEVPKMSKQGTAGKRKHATLMIPQKLEISRSMQLVEAKERLWLHTTVDCQLSVI
jgi:hypothetical protein